MTTPAFDPQPCCDGADGGTPCLAPMQFCQTTTSTGPVEHPGRMYDITLPINPGFDVTSLLVDAATYPAGIVWNVDDPDGEAFRQELTTFLEGRLPAPAVVTITNPNAGVQQVCAEALPMQIHIECLRLDQDPPDLVELTYNGGQDLIQNPAYNEFPPLDPPVSQGNYGFHLLSRQDDPGPFPGNPPANDALCTSVANQGWETNDIGRTFEIWGRDVAQGQNTTPTPRGTPVQEMTSDGPPPGGRSTIWQTFTAPSSGNFVIRVVHGARDTGEQHRITLDNGDTDDAQNGDLIDDISNPPSVTSSGGPNPWTQFDQSIPLNGGNTYTLALSTNNPVSGARGGLFTDMRAFLDRPGLRATATTDDETCTVTTTETTTSQTCEFWQPGCEGGAITTWTNVKTGTTLTNAEFWAQTPEPECCTTPAGTDGEGGGGGVQSNMMASELVCATVNGVPRNVIRTVIVDPSGGRLQEVFIGTDGVPITPDTWVPGGCTSERVLVDFLLCDQGNNNHLFLRKYVQSFSETGLAQINAIRDFEPDGSATYTPVGPVGVCGGDIVDQEVVCWTTTAGGLNIFTGTIRHDDSLPAPGWMLFDQHTTPVNPSEPGLTFVSCSAVVSPIATTGLCLADGTPIAIVTRRNTQTTALIQDGWFNLLTGTFSPGAPPVGTQACGQNLNIQTSDVLCDMNTGTGTVNALVLIQYNYNPDGSIASTSIIDATTGDPYVPVGTITVCPTDTAVPDNDMQVLCDRQVDGTLVPFIRDYFRGPTGTITGFTDYSLGGGAYTVTGTVQSCIPRDVESMILCDSAAPTPNRFVRTYTYTQSGTIASFADATLAGAPFTPTGTVQVCPGRDVEVEILCDSATPTPNRFMRRYNYGALTGALIAFNDTTLDGSTAFTPTGAVGVCAQTVQSDTDFVEEVMSDANGTCFLRLFRFNSVTGALISTTNTTLAGAAFTPVGAVTAGCASCCPQVLADDLCTNTGSGRGSAIRAANGTVTLIDSVTGAAITAGNIIPCVNDDTVRTLSAQGRLVGDADPAWTPGADVTGTLTSVTLTILSGTATVTDANGTVMAGLPAGYTATWTAEDDNTLTGPTSIDAVGGQTAVVWTQR